MSKRFKTGELIGDYRIEGFLGAGGMGEVYLGLHTRLQRYAAVKVLNLSSMENSLSIRFQNEARLQSGLHHPNIATLYDFKEIGNQLFIFMEYVDGEPLEDLIERKFFSVDQSLLVFHAIVEAVSFVHSSGVIHRDLKSQNIKLTSEGVPKLLDFGIAKDSKSSKLTRTGGVIGTPNYIAPEQLLGEKASASTDVWALGILLYEMLTGEMPFQADNIGQLCEKIKRGNYPPIQTINQAVPNGVARIVEKCLDVDPTRRYQRALDLSFDVSRILKKQYGVSAGSTDAIGRLFDPVGDYSFENYEKQREFSPRSLTIWAFGLTGVFLAIVFFSLVGIWGFSGSPENPKNEKTLVENTPVPENSPPIGLLPSVKPNIEPEKTPEMPKPQTDRSADEGLGQKITIDVIQSSAEVVRNGQVIGKTPYQLSGREGETVRLTLRREGYQDKEIEVEINSRKRFYTYSLKEK